MDDILQNQTLTNNINHHLLQGILQYKKGCLKEAEPFFRLILKDNPKHPDANHYLGVILSSSHNINEAIIFFKLALEQNQNSEQFWISYIEALIKLKKFKKAKKYIIDFRKKGIDNLLINILDRYIISDSTKININNESVLKQLSNNLIKSFLDRNFNDAEKLAISITKQFPNDNLSWKILGSILKNTDRMSYAAYTGEIAVKINPKDFNAHYDLGNTYQKLKRFKESELSYKKAIKLKDDFTNAYYNLGISLQEIGHLEEAEKSYRQVIKLDSGYTYAYNNLGNILKDLKRFNEAEIIYNKVINLKPNYAEVYNNLGIVLKHLSRLEESILRYKQAINLNPSYAQAFNNLGTSLKELGRVEDAKECLKKALLLKPDDIDFLTNLGNIFSTNRQFEDAFKIFKKAEALNPFSSTVHSNLGNILKFLGRLDEAKESYTTAINLDPKFAEAHYNLGIIFKELGVLKKSEACFSQAIKLRKDFAEAHRSLSLMKVFNKKDEQFIQMEQLYFSKKLADEELSHLCFALAKACEDLGEIKNAFKYYSQANKLCKKILNYDISKDINLFNNLRTNYTNLSKQSVHPKSNSNNLTPVFIIGMPRSGTTLVEQIVSSHSKVTGAGELSLVAQFGNALATGSTQIDKKGIIDFRRKYLESLKSHSNGNLIITDKMPWNFIFLGLLSVAFPEAKFVHVKRNSSAVCWANFKQYFTSEYVGYCYDLDDIVVYYKLYKSLMQFWYKTIRSRIYDLDYELLTNQQQDETRKLINYLDLDWENRCLSPQDNSRRVATASNLQVRKKVYKGSSENWKKYKPFLNGVFDNI